MSEFPILGRISQQAILEALNTVTDNPHATPHLKGLRDSAVLVIFHQQSDGWHILFTKRSEELKDHAGQISFPGGRKDKKDSDFRATAIRETTEEIGITNDHLAITAELTPVCTLTGYRIYPYVSFIEKLPTLQAEQNEVDEIFSVPLDYVCAVNNLKPIKKHYRGQEFTTYQLLWQQHNIWGATAHMLADLRYRIRTHCLTSK